MRGANLTKLGLLCLAGVVINAAQAAPVNDNFANAIVINGTTGVAFGDNNSATLESSEANQIIIDFPVPTYVSNSVWYAWTAPASGNVTFDTIGSDFDTVLAVYTGNGVSTLTLIAANDDIADGNVQSQVGFYAVAGNTYRIAIYGLDQPPVAVGNIELNWSMQTPGFSAGQFKFTSKDYVVSQRESSYAEDSSMHPKKNTPDPLGARVTVTRVGGAVGRVEVNYTVTNAVLPSIGVALVYGFNTYVSNFDSGGNLLGYTNIYTTAYQDFTGSVNPTTVNGLSPTILAQDCFTGIANSTVTTIESNGLTSGPFTIPTNSLPAVFENFTNIVSLTNGDGSVTFLATNSFFNIINVTNYLPAAIPRDPKHPTNIWDYVPVSGTLVFNDYEMSKDIYITVNTNNIGAPYTTNGLNAELKVTLDSATLDPSELQSIPAPTLDPTNSSTRVDILNIWQNPGFCGSLMSNVFNFERSTLSVERGKVARIAVNRSEFALSDGKAAKIFYEIDHKKKNDDWNTFPLQAGSDYAIPDDATKTAQEGVTDFDSVIGELDWKDGDFDPKFISISNVDNGTVEFNKDYVVQFFEDSGHTWSDAAAGNISACTVTILYDKEPAGAVDRGYNPESVINPDPGVNGPVYAVAVQPNGRALIGGDFTAYDGTNAVCIARAKTNGALDVAFAQQTASGPDGFVDAIALDTNNNIFIGGGFSSFNGNQRNGIARLNPDGSLDDTFFKPGLGFDGTVSAILVQPDGQILAAGNFTSYNNTNRNCIVRLNPDGSVDSTFDSGAGPLDDFYPAGTTINSMALQSDGRIVIGGDFTSVDGISRNYIARLNADGSLDTSFDPGEGANDLVYSVAVDANGLIIVGGAFTQLGTLGGSQGIARLNADGSVDTTFADGSGANDIVYNVALQPDGGILLAGIFNSINQTRRVGLARLLPDGTLDTSFMDTAYNQFAGMINPYYNPDINSPNPIYSMALQTNGDIIIGGYFSQVGGGSSRDDIRARNNVARIVGGSTPGPGNMELGFDSYSTEAGVSLGVTVNRVNGSLGPAEATIQPVPLPTGPGAAVAGVDYVFSGLNLIWGVNYSDTWMLSDGKTDTKFPLVTALSSTNGNTSLNLQMTDPKGSDMFFLGGENIPLGVALGRSLAPFNIIQNNLNHGTLSLNPQGYIVNENGNNAVINVFRTGGGDGSVTVHYKTLDGTAINGTDYTAKTGTLTFPPYPTAGWSNQVFTVPINNNPTAQPDRIVNLQIYTPGGGVVLGTTNSQLVIIDDDYSAGSINFVNGIPLVIGTSNVMTYGVNENASTAMITVSRLGGNTGTLIASVASGGGTAVNGVNYAGFTNQITWNNGIGGPTNIFIPLKDDSIETSNLIVNLRIFGATVNGGSSLLALGAYTNAALTITNTDFKGTLQFSSPTYSFNENGGQAVIPVTRTGGSAGTISAAFATFDGTAFSNIDYSMTNGILTFTNGEISKIFQVPVIDNVNQDDNRSLFLVLTNFTPASVLGSPSNATLTIVDDETYNQPPGSPDTGYYPLAGFDNSVFALALEPSDNKLLVGGDFTFANGVGRNRIARLNSDGTLDSKFSSYLSSEGADNVVRTIAVQTDGRILVGGFFTNFNGSVLNHIARLNYNGSLDSSFNPGSGANNPVYALAETFVGGQRKVLIAGAFTTVNGVSRNSIARLNDNGSIDTTFSSGIGANGTVYAIALQNDGKIIIGGDFTAINNVPLNHVARLNADGSVDTSFTNAVSNGAIGPNNSVYAIAIQLDGRILIGGAFTNVSGNIFNHVARLNQDGSVDNSFTPGLGANDTVETISLQDDTRILLGGNFTTCNGVTRNRVTRLNPDGTADLTINFGLGADGFVAASVIQPDGKIILGGGFLNYDGTPHAHLVRIYGGSMAGSGAFSFSSANYQVDETNLAVITVRRTGGTSGLNPDGSGDIFVNFNTSDGTAYAGINYSNVNVNLDFPPGEVFETVNVPLINAVSLLPSVTVNLALTNATSPAIIGNQPFATLTILNDLSAVNFAATNYSVAKNAVNGFGIMHVARLGSTNNLSTVDFYTTTNGTAVVGTDYNPASGTVTFNPGDADKTIQIPIINNNLSEGDKTVIVALTNAVGSELFVPSNSTLTIIDTVIAPGNISLSTNNYVVGEGDGYAHIPVIRANGSSGVVSVSYTTVTGTAASGINYISTNGVLTFDDPNINTKFIDVPLVDNNLVQGPRNLSIVLSNPTGGASLVTPANANITINDNDIGLAFSVGTNTVSETAGSIVLNVLRLYVTNTVTTVHYSTTNGTAIAGVNYGGIINGTLTFATGEAIKPIIIPIIDDTNVTGDLAFTVGLSSPSPPAQIVSPSAATVVVQDADAGLRFIDSTMTVSKDVGNAIISVICSNTNAEPISVNYSTSDGTAIAGINYSSTAGTLVFAVGIVTNTFSVPIINNSQVTSNLTFTVSLFNPTAPGQIVSPGTLAVTIKESNSGFKFSSPAYSVVKNGVTATINVFRIGNTDSVASVNYFATNGTAVAGVNFFPASGTLVFTNGVTNRSFNVTVIDYPAVQPDLTVLMQLLNPTNGFLMTPSAATLTIHDNSGSYVIPAGSALVSESGVGTPNGIIDTNESVTVLFGFRDAGGTNVANLIATLLATNGVTSPSPSSQVYGPLTFGGHSVSRPFSFTAHGTNGQQVQATFQLNDNGTKDLGTALFSYTLGAIRTSYSNTAAIIINDLSPAAPYPSTINVSGLPGTLIKATVTLTNVSHTSPSDIDALLVAPDQLNTLIMAHAGYEYGINNVTIKFDDAATNSLPEYETITNGVYQPTAYTNSPYFYPVFP